MKTPNLTKQLASTYRSAGWLVGMLMRARLFILPLEALLEEAQVGEVALDLGCGFGLLSRALALKCPTCRVIGVDLDHRRLQIAARKDNHQVASRTSFVCGSAVQLPLKGRFSAIFCVDLLHHLPYELQEAVLRSLRGLLEKQGQLWIKEIDRAPRWKYLFNYFHDVIYNRQRPNCRSAGEWEQLLNSSGFHCEVKRLDRRSPYSHVLLQAHLLDG